MHNRAFGLDYHFVVVSRHFELYVLRLDSRQSWSCVHCSPHLDVHVDPAAELNACSRLPRQRLRGNSFESSRNAMHMPQGFLLTIGRGSEQQQKQEPGVKRRIETRKALRSHVVVVRLELLHYNTKRLKHPGKEITQQKSWRITHTLKNLASMPARPIHSNEETASRNICRRGRK